MKSIWSSMVGRAFRDREAALDSQQRHPARRKLTRNVAWSFWGNAIYAACQWAMIVLIAKLADAESVGRFTLGLSVTAPIVLLSNLQLRAAQATDARGEYTFQEYFRLRLGTTTFALAVTVGFCLLVSWPYYTLLAIFLVGLSKGVEAISDVCWGALQQKERMDWVAVSMILKGLAAVLATGLALVFTGSLIVALVGLVLGWMIVLWSYDFDRTRRALHGNHMPRPSILEGSLREGKIRLLLVSMFPLGLVTALESLNVGVPRYFLEHRLGEGPLGIFGAITYTQTAVLIVVRSVGQAVSPRLALCWHEQRYSSFAMLLSSLVGSAVVAGVLGVLVALFWGGEILALLYRPEYREYTDVFVLTMAAAAWMMVGSACVFGIMAMRVFWPQVYLYAITVAGTVAFCVLSGPETSVAGIAWAVVASSVLHALVGMFLVGVPLWREIRLRHV